MIGFGIIGCGLISSTHLTAIKSDRNSKLIGCCDINTQKGHIFARKNRCKFYKNFKELIKDSDIDAVTIATPHYLHKEMAEFALNCNKNVISEKPMATTVHDAKEILNIANNSSAKYTVCFQNRFNKSFIQAKKFVDSKCFGELKGIKVILTWNRDDSYYNLTDWKGSKFKEGGGVLINQAIHSIDAITWLVGLPVKIKGKVMTSLLEKSIEVEDAAIATGIMNNGARLVIMASNDYSANPDPVITLNFEKATLKLSMAKLSVDDSDIFIAKENEGVSCKDYWGNGHKKLFQVFTDNVLGVDNKLSNILPENDAINSLKVVEAIYESAKTDNWITLN